MALWWSAQMSIQVTVRGLGGRTYLDKADWIYHADPQISTSMSLIYAISWFTIVALERWKVEKISRFDSQCDLYWHVDLAFEIWSCSGLRHRASIFHGQSVHWREGVDRRAWLKHYRLSYDVFAKRDVKLCRAMTLMTSLHEDIVGGNAAKDVYGNGWMVLNSGLLSTLPWDFGQTCKSPEGCGNSSQERCCGFLSTGTSSLQMNVTDNFKTVPVVNFEVASTQKDMLQIFN